MAPGRRTSKRQCTQKKKLEDEDNNPVTTKQPVRRVRGKRGGLSQLPSMPLDVVFEIMSCLHPLDLLHLARTSKDLRRLLMSRTSSHVWRAAREGTGSLPPCPDDMSEPAYVNLLFRSICHNCGRSPCEKIYWDCRARYCNSCQGAVSITVEYLGSLVPSPLNHLPAYLFVPAVQENSTIRAYSLGAQYKVLFLSDWVTFKQDLSKIKDQQDLLPFIQARAEQMQIKRTQTEMLAIWKSRSQRERDDANAQLTRERIQDVKARLAAMGYKTELEDRRSDALNSHPLVAQPKVLTDRIWKNMEPKIVKIMEKIRHDRLKVSRGPTITKRLRVFDEAVLAIQPRKRNEPSLRDIALNLHEVRKVITRPGSEEVTISSFDFLRTALPDFSQQWTDEINDALRGLVRGQIELGDSVDPLDLAVGSVFICKGCNDPVSLQDVRSHTCRRRAEYPFSNRDYYSEIVVQTLPVMNWEPDMLSTDMGLLKSVIEKFGFDPRTATVVNVDASPTRVTCPEHNPRCVLEIMDWRSAYLHCRERQSKCTPDKWQVVGNAQLEVAKPLEAISRRRHEDCRSCWRCVHCPLIESTLQSKQRTLEHVQTKHEIEKPTDEDVVYGTTLPSLLLTPPVHLIDTQVEGKWQGDRFKSDTAAFFSFS